MRVRRLTPRDVAAYREIMLEGYGEAHEAFTATVEERRDLPLDWWAPRVSDAGDADRMVFGTFLGDELVGVAGLRFERRPRTRHKAALYGMYVRAGHRGGGVAGTLVQAVLDAAREAPETALVQLTVAAGNQPAIRLYESFGFRVFGTEPLALRMGDGFVEMLHMWRRVDDRPASERMGS